MKILAVALVLGGILTFQAAAGADEAAVTAKLDEIVKTQNEILRQLGEIKEELNIVKIRASIR